MASRINEAYMSTPQAAQTRLRGATLSGNGYRAAQVQVKQPSESGLLNSFLKFGEAAVGAFARYDNEQEKAGKEQGEWLTKFARENPEEYKRQFDSGTLRYQDNKYAMQFLKRNIGSNAIYRADAEMQKRIKSESYGAYGPEDEKKFNEDRRALHKQYVEEDAKLYGIDPTDEYFQFGAAADTEQRNINMFDSWESAKASFNENAGIVNARQTLSGSTNTLSATNGAAHADNIVGYINSAGDNALLTSKQREAILKEHLTDLAKHPYGLGAIDAMGEKAVNLYGKSVKLKDYIGQEQWANIRQQASNSAMEMNRELTRQYADEFDSARLATDPEQGLATLDRLEEQAMKLAPGEHQTALLTKIQGERSNLRYKLKEKTDKLAAEQDKANQKSNRELRIQEYMTRAANGEFGLPLSPDLMPTDENSGSYTQEDFTNVASRMVTKMMNNPNQTREQNMKDVMAFGAKLGKNGYVQKVLAPLVDEAQGAVDAFVIHGKPWDNAAFEQAQAMYQADPVGFQQLFGSEKTAELTASMYMLNKYGLTPEDYFTSEKELKRLDKSPDKGMETRNNFLMNSGNAKNLNWVSSDVQDAAYRIYLSARNRGIDTTKALRLADDFAGEHVETFDAPEGGNLNVIGQVPKTFLQVRDGDLTSISDGKGIMERNLQTFAVSAGINKADVQMSYQAGEVGGEPFIVLHSKDNQYVEVFSQSRLRNEYTIEADKAQKVAAEKRAKWEAEDKARTEKLLADSKKKAPITRATEARKAAGKRAQEKRKAVPNAIYGGKTRKLQSGEPKQTKKESAKAPEGTRAKINRLVD